MAAPAALKNPTRRRTVWTVADLHRKFGPISCERIRPDPPPGCGTVADVERLNDHEDRLYELIDGVLVEKTVGIEDSILAGYILTLLNIYVLPRGLGLVAGEAGTIRLDIDLVRIPDVAFFSTDRLPAGGIPGDAVPLLVPDLAVEVISKSNTRKEIDDKLKEYFDKGVRLVWYVRPRSRVVDVYTSPERFIRLTASMQLDGGDVLPGLSVRVGELFELPKRPGEDRKGTKDGPRPGKANGRRGRSG